MRHGISRLLPARLPLTFLLLSTGLTLCIMHLLTTDYQSFSYDIGGHTKYIKFIASHHTLPKPDACWQCWQPPLYYVAAAMSYGAGQYLGMHEPLAAVRFLSLLCYVVFLYYSICMIRENIHSRPAYYIALALLVFWPLGMAKATLINNDLPLYMAQLGGFYYLVRWWKNLDPRDISIALLWNALAINFKNNGITLTAVIACMVLYRWIKTRFPLGTLYNRKTLVMLTLALLLALPPLARNYYFYRIETPRANSLMVSNLDGLPRETWINDDRPLYYLGFDFGNYLAYPFNASNGEWYYFWNGVLKSSLFGEHVWKPLQWGMHLSMAELALLYYMLCSGIIIMILDKKPQPDWASSPAPFILFVGVHVAALMVYRILYPNVCSNDYRYIYAITPLMALLYARIIQWYQEYNWPYIAWLGVILGMVFAFISVILITLQDLQ